MQPWNHIELQVTPPIEHFMHPVSAAYERDEIARL
jgi:hypothetical protein